MAGNVVAITDPARTSAACVIAQSPTNIAEARLSAFELRIMMCPRCQGGATQVTPAECRTVTCGNSSQSSGTRMLTCDRLSHVAGLARGGIGSRAEINTFGTAVFARKVGGFERASRRAPACHNLQFPGLKIGSGRRFGPSARRKGRPDGN